MTPYQEANELVGKFYAEIGFYPQSKRCAIVSVKELIKSLQKNRGYTQCTIDLKHYEAVLVELEGM
jgi:hypothetical protein